MKKVSKLLLFVSFCTILFLAIPISAQASDASRAKSAISASAKKSFIVEYYGDDETTIMYAEFDIAEYYDDLLYSKNIDATVEVTWKTPPKGFTTAVAAKDYNFSFVIFGSDGSEATITTKLAKVKITSEGTTYRAIITSVAKPSINVRFNTNKATTIEDVEEAVLNYYDRYLMAEGYILYVEVKWNNPPTKITGPIATKDYSFTIQVDGTDYSIEYIDRTVSISIY